MSHYTVAIITKDETDVDYILSSFTENVEYMDKEKLTFFDGRVECVNDYNTEEIKAIKKPDGSYISYFSKEAENYIEHKNGELVKLQDCEITEIKANEIYKTLDEYLSEYKWLTFNEEKQTYGYWYNPNAKWDWYSIGGRWSGCLLTKRGNGVNSCLLDDLAIIPENWDALQTMYKKLCEAEQNNDETVLKEYEFYSWEDWHYYKENIENYPEKPISLTYAVITPDGEWHEPGQMLWFGISAASDEERDDWSDKYVERFITPYRNQNYYVVLVDCHI